MTEALTEFFLEAIEEISPEEKELLANRRPTVLIVGVDPVNTNTLARLLVPADYHCAIICHSKDRYDLICDLLEIPKEQFKGGEVITRTQNLTCIFNPSLTTTETGWMRMDDLIDTQAFRVEHIVFQQVVRDYLEDSDYGLYLRNKLGYDPLPKIFPGFFFESFRDGFGFLVNLIYKFHNDFVKQSKIIFLNPVLLPTDPASLKLLTSITTQAINSYLQALNQSDKPDRMCTMCFVRRKINEPDEVMEVAYKHLIEHKLEY